MANFETSDTRDILTVDEALRYLRIARPTLYRYTSQKRIPHFHVGRKVLFDRQELDEWLDGKRVEPVQ